VSTLGILVLVLAGLAAGGILLMSGLLVAGKARALAHRRARGGAEGLLGRVGDVRASGQVFVDGALWRARPWSREEPPLRPGEPVVVERVDGLTLTVRRAEEWEVAP